MKATWFGLVVGCAFCFSSWADLPINIQNDQFTAEENVIHNHSQDPYTLEVLGRLRLEREFLEHENDRWWAQFDLEKRRLKIRQFRRTFGLGIEDAELLSQGLSGNNYCQAVRQLTPPKQFPTDRFLNDAYIRGFRSFFAPCFVSDKTAMLRNYFRKIQALQKNVFDVQSGLIINRPTDVELLTLSRDMESRVLEVIRNSLEGENLKLSKILDLETETLRNKKERILEKARNLAQHINCSNLEGRFGETYNCSVTFVPSPLKLNFSDSTLFLFDQKNLGSHATRIVYNDLFEAAAQYQQYLGRPDPILNYLISDIRTSLGMIQNQMTQTLENLKNRFQRKFSENQFENELIDNDLWRSFYSKQERGEFVSALFEVKQALDAFEVLELSTEVERGLLLDIVESYQNVLAEASTASFSLELPVQSSLRLDLDDEEKSYVEFPWNRPALPRGFFLGYSENEVNQIFELLRL